MPSLQGECTKSVEFGYVREFVRPFVLRVDALFSIRTENCIAIRFAAYCTGIRTRNRKSVDGPLLR
jgi:hypothetical protein